MTPVTRNIALGFYDDQATPTVYAKVEDTERAVIFELVDGLVGYVVEDVTHIYLKETFSNNVVLAPVNVLPDAEFSDDHTIMTIKLTKSMLSVPGTARCELLFCKCNEDPVINEDGSIDWDQVDVLSTQVFHIFIDNSAYTGGCMSAADQMAVSELVPLVIKVESIIKHDEEYQENEAQRMANEVSRISNEGYRQEAENARVKAEEERAAAEDAREDAEDVRQDNEDERIANEVERNANEEARKASEAERKRLEDNRILNEKRREENETDRVRNSEEMKRAEQERIAREGWGTYNNRAEYITYFDTDGNEQKIKYQDSRVGVYERVKALNDGGYYVDEAGDTQYVSNVIRDRKGNAITVDTSMLDGVSYEAIAAYCKMLADDDFWAKMSESYAHGDTGIEERPDEDTDNAKYYCNRSSENYTNTKTVLEKVQAILDSINDAIDTNIPDVQVDMTTGHLLYQGGKFDLGVNASGHLQWSVV